MLLKLGLEEVATQTADRAGWAKITVDITSPSQVLENNQRYTEHNDEAEPTSNSMVSRSSMSAS